VGEESQILNTAYRNLHYFVVCYTHIDPHKLNCLLRKGSSVCIGKGLSIQKAYMLW